MGITDKARQAAERDRVTATLAEMAGVTDDPQKKTYVPESQTWDKFQAEAEESLAFILGDYPTGAHRIEPESWAMRNFAHQYPADLRRKRLIIWDIEGTEVATIRRKGGGFHHWVVLRSANPMEEAGMVEFDDLAGFGQAIS